MRYWKPLSGVVLAALAIGAYEWKERAAPAAQGQAAATQGGPPRAMPVPTTPVVRKSVPLYLEYSARTEAVQNLSLQPKVSGFLLAQNAADGSDVKTGDLLYTIDARDFQAALDQANAQVQRDTAALDYARANSSRGAELGKTGFLAKDTVEQRRSSERQAQAALVNDQAAVRAAQLNIERTEIRAPFDGRLGRNQASIGALVTVGGAALNTLVELDRIYVTFNPSENDLARIRKAQAEGRVKAEVFMPSQNRPGQEGELTFVDNSVDRSTGTIVARATFKNVGRSMLPGQYVQLRLLVGQQENALMAPLAAVGSNQMGKYFYVVGAGDKAEQRLVTLGPEQDGLVVVQKGLAEGDRVITGNLQKIGPGAPVAPLPPPAQQGLNAPQGQSPAPAKQP